jgi:Ni/Co efflux regulator RcnB
VISRSVLIVSVACAAMAVSSSAFAGSPSGGDHSGASSTSSGGGSHGGGGGGGGGSSGGGHSGGGGGGHSSGGSGGAGAHGASGGGHGSIAPFSAAYAGGVSASHAGGAPAGGGLSPLLQHGAVQPDRPTALTAWMGSNNTPQRAHLAAVWRSQNHDLDKHAPWKHGGDWWKGRPGFKGYHGHRHHHRFIPDIGYVELSDDCSLDTLAIGAFAPRCMLTYTVADWASYGLPPPPGGCEWVWLDGAIALVQISDGYIIEIVPQVF